MDKKQPKSDPLKTQPIDFAARDHQWGDAEEFFSTISFDPAKGVDPSSFDEIVGVCDGSQYVDPITDSTYNERVEGKFFARCASDEHGHCLAEGDDVVSAEELETARRLARTKARLCPKPTDEQIKSANDKINEKGADRYEADIRGSSKDRAAARQKLLYEFGDGKTCACIYCGRKLTDETLTRDKIYTAREGGRYTNANTAPACLGCNKSRGDIPWGKIRWTKPT